VHREIFCAPLSPIAVPDLYSCSQHEREAPGLQAVLYSLYKPEALDRARVDKSLILNGLGE